MDGLDTYIDDYSKPDPIAPDVVARLAQARYIFDPPATRVDESGFVVDVPADEPRRSEGTTPPLGGLPGRRGLATRRRAGCRRKARPPRRPLPRATCAETRRTGSAVNPSASLRR